MRKKLLIYKLKHGIVIVVLLLALLSLIGMTSSGQGLAEDYAPILYFEGEETCYPIDADFQIDNSYLYGVDNSVPISTDPTDSSISAYSTDSYKYYYLDNQVGDVGNYNKIISDAKAWENTNGNTVYYRTYSTGITEVVQYWFYYAFNEGELNQHEGDWEMVQVALINGDPTWVAYSQHHSGQWAEWNQVEKEGSRIKVYVARGSHANYLRSFSGKLGAASDIVGANGEVMNPNRDYNLKSLDDQLWLNYHGRWGECGADIADFASNEAIGRNGPPGPMYREEGNMWDDPVSWGKSVPQANDLFFTAEWFIYNFVLIYMLITIAFIALAVFLIFRRHKKYGLGPRIVSILYIDGLNLKSIGNILCIIGIIIAAVGLFSPWYAVSYDPGEVSGIIEVEGGMQNVLLLDGIEGIQISIPGENGPMPMGAVSIPFSIIIGISLIFLFIASIGISQSKKLGWKYIWRGIKLLIPVIIIIIVIMSIGGLASSIAGSNEVANTGIDNIFSSISSSPFGGQETFSFASEGFTVSVPMSWGLGLGAQLLLFAGILLLIAGILEIMAKTQFFATKIPLPDKGPAKMAYQPPQALPSQQPPVQKTPPPPPPPVEPKPEKQKKKAPAEKKKTPKFCPNCGAPLEDSATFCVKCGKQLNK